MSRWDNDEFKFEDLVGKTLIIIEQNGDYMKFVDVDNNEYGMSHSQDCCESVYIKQIDGELDDLIGSPILLAEESTGGGSSSYGDELWTFYKLATVHGHVTITWYGESNGYYSVSVDFYKIRVRDY